MSTAGSIRAGKAFIELSLDTTKLKKSIANVSRTMKNMGNSIRSVGINFLKVGTMMTAPIIAATMKYARFGDNIAKMSKRTGVGAQALSELQYAAERSGSTIEALDKGFRRMARVLIDSSDGLKDASDSLERIGLNYEMLSKLSPEEQFTIIADRISKLSDDTTRAAAAQEIFGRSGAELIPMMRSGAKGIDELRKKARELGLVMSDEDAAAAEVLTDQLADVKDQFKFLAIGIGADVMPTIMEFSKRVQSIVGVVQNWVKNNKELFNSIFKIGATLMTIGTVLTVFGITLAAVGTAIGALTSPIVLVIAAIVGLGYYLESTANIMSDALSWITDKFNKFKDRNIEAIQGIKDALASDDIRTAAKLFWAMISVEFYKGSQDIQDTWIDLKEQLELVWIDLSISLSQTMANAATYLKAIWNETINYITSAMNKGVGFAKVAFNSITNMGEAMGSFWYDYTVGGKSFDEAVAGYDKIVNAGIKANDKILDDTKAVEKEIQLERDKTTEKILSDGEKLKDELKKISEEKKKIASDERDEERKALEEKIKNIDKEYQEVLKKSKENKQKMDNEDLSLSDQLDPSKKIKGLGSQIASALSGIGGSMSSALARGSFSVSNQALLSLSGGGDSIQHKILEANMGTERYAREIAKNTKEGGVFDK